MLSQLSYLLSDLSEGCDNFGDSSASLVIDWCRAGDLFLTCICVNKYILQFNTRADEH